MIIYLRILSNEVDNFVKEIAIDDTLSFADLHACIQDTLNYDASQMASFFTTDSGWNKESEITLLDMSEGHSSEIKVMHNTLISDFLFEEGQRLLYVFDFFSERAFFIEVIEIKKGSLDKPNCYRNEGETPQQIMIGDFTEETTKPDLDQFDDEFDGTLDSMKFNDLDHFDDDLNLDDLADQY
ncbi:IS1096 element passenger TnpR family protein [Carboxylicivirga taeanensis]|uniref:IS1096 element passenger TnpR family protein n=1 Tax=Carboxylicivirga taeanensis TaxID=1416875 RepID=UPI003F6E36B8